MSRPDRQLDEHDTEPLRDNWLTELPTDDSKVA
jgi:hypothetical protein